MKHVRQDNSEHPSAPPGSRRRSPKVGLRLRVHLHRARLDRQLADGLAAEAFHDRALRATQLAGMPTRRQVARSLRRLVENAERPTGVVVSAAVPVRRRSVLAWREALLGLAERLEQPVPLDPCGVARALILLT